MTIPFWFKYQWRLARIKPTRYKTLIKEIYEHRARNIIEVGVFNGSNSLRMIEAAKVLHHVRKIYYYGFDLFEMLTEHDLKEEFSKPPLSEQAIYDKLRPTGANINLFKGYSQNTLKEFVENNKDLAPDFIYIDGGHHIETIRSDWNYLSEIMGRHTVVVFDDYYENKEKAILDKGCNDVIHNLDPTKYNVEILDPINEFEQDWGVLRVRFAKVMLV